MSVELKNNTFLNYLFILASLFVIVLFTKWQIMNYFELQDVKYWLEQDIAELREEQDSLNKIAVEVEKEWDETQRYNITITEDKIIDYLYTYAQTISNDSGSVMITNISLSDEKENQFGFLERTINLDAQVSDVQTMKNLLDYLVAEDAKYRFFIDTFYYPNDNREGSFNVQVPLKIFYR